MNRVVESRLIKIIKPKIIDRYKLKIKYLFIKWVRSINHGKRKD